MKHVITPLRTAASAGAQDDTDRVQHQGIDNPSNSAPVTNLLPMVISKTVGPNRGRRQLSALPETRLAGLEQQRLCFDGQENRIIVKPLRPREDDASRCNGPSQLASL